EHAAGGGRWLLPSAIADLEVEVAVAVLQLRPLLELVQRDQAVRGAHRVVPGAAALRAGPPAGAHGPVRHGGAALAAGIADLARLALLDHAVAAHRVFAGAVELHGCADLLGGLHVVRDLELVDATDEAGALARA